MFRAVELFRLTLQWWHVTLYFCLYPQTYSTRVDPDVSE